MQKKAKWFIIPFVMIIVSFVFWGIGRQDVMNPVEIVAEIGPYKIDTVTFYRSEERVREFYRNIFKEQFTAELQKTLDIRKRTIDELVDQKVLLVAAEEHGVMVSDSELQKSIMEDQNFMRDGRFDRNVYLRTLQLNRIMPVEFERSRREDMVSGKMRKMITEVVSPYSKTESLVAVPAKDDPDLERRKMLAYKAFVEGYKRKLAKEGRFVLNLNVIS